MQSPRGQIRAALATFLKVATACKFNFILGHTVQNLYKNVKKWGEFLNMFLSVINIMTMIVYIDVNRRWLSHYLCDRGGDGDFN